MTRPTLSSNPCRACGAAVRTSTPATALCRDCRDASYAAFKRAHVGLHPDAWQRALNVFQTDCDGRAALARALNDFHSDIDGRAALVGVGAL